MEAEARLVHRLAQGDDQALDALYEALARNVFALALQMLGAREDAEEVVQDTFVQVHRHAARFDGRRGSVRAWIYTIARNACRMRLRARGARPRRDPGADPHDPASPMASAPQGPDATDRLALMQAFAHLDREEVRLLEASFFGGYSHGELADREGQPVGTIKSRIRRAMSKARHRLTGADASDERASRARPRDPSGSSSSAPSEEGGTA